MVGKALVSFDKVIVHCSDTPNRRPVKTSEIDHWHRERGFSGIGYHYVIELDSIEIGRSLTRYGAHTRGHNKGSIGICIIGRDDFSRNQWRMLADLYRHICREHGILDSAWHCHHEFNALKTCPGFTRSELQGFIRGLNM